MNENKDLIARVQQANLYLDKDYNLDGQLNWYDKKAVFNKTWHMRLGLIIIIAGAATSIVQIWSPPPTAGRPLECMAFGRIWSGCDYRQGCG